MNQPNLSEQQSRVVNITDGPIFVNASAGSGKTRVLTERIRNLVSKTNRKILALTFTNKASDEIRDRLELIDNLSERVFIGTFHSFCQYVLENHGYSIGLSPMPHIFENENDRLRLIEQAMLQVPTFKNNYSSMSNEDQKAYCFKALNYFSKVKRELKSIEEITKNENIISLYKVYQDILISQWAMDFDDLILYAHQLLSENQNIASLYQRSFKYICIDEAQDLNNAQYKFLKTFIGDAHRNIMMVGDPKQSIFAFNGSSPQYMSEQFVKDYSPEIIQLTENYRSSKKVLEAASKIISLNSSDIICNIAKKGEFHLFKAGDQSKEAIYVFNKINELVESKFHDDIEGEITLERIAVLARNKFVFHELEQLFIQEKIPYNYKMSLGPVKFQSNIVKAFDLALRVRLNNKDKLHWSELLKILNIHQKTLSSENNEDTNLNLSTLIDKTEVIFLRNVIEAVVSLKEDGTNLKNTLEILQKSLKDYDSSDGEVLVAVSEINEYLTHWYIYSKSTSNKSLHQFKTSMALGKTHNISEHNGVTFSTVHTMKGQEFDIVFIIGLDDGTFPDYRATQKIGQELEQERNNLYVAFTRAKRLLFASWPEYRKMPWGTNKKRIISRFLKNIE